MIAPISQDIQKSMFVSEIEMHILNIASLLWHIWFPCNNSAAGTGYYGLCCGVLALMYSAFDIQTKKMQRYKLKKVLHLEAFLFLEQGNIKNHQVNLFIGFFSSASSEQTASPENNIQCFADILHTDTVYQSMVLTKRKSPNIQFV